MRMIMGMRMCVLIIAYRRCFNLVIFLTYILANHVGSGIEFFFFFNYILADYVGSEIVVPEMMGSGTAILALQNAVGGSRN